MVKPELGAEGTELEIQILGKRCPAMVIPEGPTTRKTCGLEHEASGAEKIVARIATGSRVARRGESGHAGASCNHSWLER